MKFSTIVSSLCLLATARTTFADETEAGLEPLLETPTKLWSAQLFPDVNLGAVEIEAGNGVFMAPDGKHALVTTVGATVYAFNAYTGEQAWVYQPAPISGTIARSHSGVVFGPGVDYMVYAVVDNENSMSPSSRVIALDMDGNEVWISDDLDGVAAGNPAISSDGSHVFLTHNADNLSNGYFTILDGESGSIVYEGSSGQAGDVPTNRYGPVGIFHTPVAGNYDPIISGSAISEGEFNTNDFLMWSQSPKPTDTSIPDGYLYAFQFPRDFAGNYSDVGFFQIGNFIRDFQSVTPPVITNGGLSAYWGVSRGGFRGWIPKRFSRARDVSIGFTRNPDFAGQPVFAPPALSNDGPEPTIFGGTAAREFVKLSFDFEEQIVVDTDGFIKAAAKIDAEERAVYYVEDNGIVHFADFETLEDISTEAMAFTVTAEMALTPKSDVLLVANGRGVITAFQVAEIPVTDAPSDMPSDGPSMAPTPAPSVSMAPSTPAPTGSPTTLSPTTTPVVVPTEAPVALPTDAPSGSSTRSIFAASVAIVVAALMF